MHRDTLSPTHLLTRQEDRKGSLIFRFLHNSDCYLFHLFHLREEHKQQALTLLDLMPLGKFLADPTNKYYPLATPISYWYNRPKQNSVQCRALRNPPYKM
jgi:hypothetical protein